MSNRTKMVVFDWDDTLFDSKTQIMPSSNQYALEQLKLNPDVTVVIASGRAAFYFKDRGYSFDAYVTNNGHYVEAENQVIEEVFVEESLLNQLIETLKPLGGSVYGVHSNLGIKKYLEPKDPNILNHASFAQLKDYGENNPSIERSHILLAGYDPMYQNEIEKRFPEYHFHRYNGYMVDVIPHHTNKLVGILHLAKRLGILKENIIAFGDNDNDIEMLEGVGLGIAMGNAKDSVKLKAKRVTDSITEEGILKACIQLKLIKEKV
jgi:Cof subfamily protein (haloacid dehalogenase superfamily)